MPSILLTHSIFLYIFCITRLPMIYEDDFFYPMMMMTILSTFKTQQSLQSKLIMIFHIYIRKLLASVVSVAAVYTNFQ